jgi:hypothetical protein
VRGKIFTAKQKAKQQLKSICGEYGAVEETHNYLRQVHDLVRCLGHMQTSLAKLRSIEKHEQCVCLDDEDFMQHLIRHMDPFMKCERIYNDNERKGSRYPYTLEVMFNEVQDKVRAGAVDRAKETKASVLKHRGNLGHAVAVQEGGEQQQQVQQPPVTTSTRGPVRAREGVCRPEKVV